MELVLNLQCYVMHVVNLLFNSLTNGILGPPSRWWGYIVMDPDPVGINLIHSGDQ